ncbi:acyl carrier protein [Coxiella burnetii]|uniref:Acyl carrier protein n=1 Tax=Coxiella burnetii (strain RSA 493 / Nine Mile phase I) TaxID=227377 RepID=Q83EJ7_COXBU|nr:phosphopantetheine-binding protein [Coxiella burnetii]NP_819365.1 acyl carrier protein [Coxiella burnetii RSA 493]AAO89879.1 acyl carrier protein [Coxiella burnetii RSA 493]ABX78037.1 putative acyl carrier protein [Coxiella burnetii RSA 331]ACJ18959.1 acyl carrier protein [Coxiella burnetii CbuG_Q212]ACJ19802.1 acyl carrier protein [Coxiella burnetii CbuK_Q154]AIT62818.1 Putative acyl carrier protein [Coxiella burnetii str. Namibia]
MKNQINHRIKTIIAAQSQIPIENIHDNSKFHANLGFDSLDVVNLISAINMEFSLNLMENDIIHLETVAELVDCVEQKIENKSA